jgi:hypothetical protein
MIINLLYEKIYFVSTDSPYIILDITSKIRTVAMFVIVDIQTIYGYVLRSISV